jgi:hypothetical protein
LCRGQPAEGFRTPAGHAHETNPTLRPPASENLRKETFPLLLPPKTVLVAFGLARLIEAARDAANCGLAQKSSTECAKRFADIGVVRELVHTRRLPGRIASGNGTRAPLNATPETAACRLSKAVIAGGSTETEFSC